MGYMKVGLIVAISAYILYRFTPDSRPENLRDILTGKNVVVTGASSGLGKQLALHYAKQGSNVVIIARRENLLQEVVKECEKNSPLGGKAVIKYLVGDLEHVKSSAKVMQKSIELLGGTLDHLILNHAYIPINNEVLGRWEGSDEQMTGINRSFNINFLSFVHMVSAALPTLKKSNGSICVISSAAAERPAFVLPYGSSKSAVNAFFTGLRQEFLRENVNVSVTLVHLGLVRVEHSLDSVRAFSKAQGRDMVAKMENLTWMISGDEAAADLVRAITCREADLFYPSNQYLWVIRLLRLVIRNVDSHLPTIENGLSVFLNAKKYIGL